MLFSIFSCTVILREPLLEVLMSDACICDVDAWPINEDWGLFRPRDSTLTNLLHGNTTMCAIVRYFSVFATVRQLVADNAGLYIHSLCIYPRYQTLTS